MQKNPQDLLEEIQKHPTGFIDRIPTILDYVQGLETGVTYEVINPTGDWTDYLPETERQFNKKGDYLACVAFSHLNVRETSLNYKLKHNLLPQNIVDFLHAEGFIKNGKVNFSDRYLAKMSNTDIHKGNWLPNVGDAVRKYGLVAEDAWPTNENMTWDEYYAPVPEEIIKKGQKILEYFNFMYEFVDMNLAYVDEPLSEETLKAIKQSPLQITIPIPSQHATSLYDAKLVANEQELVKIFDTYDPFYFTGDKTYPIYYSVKLVEEVKKPKPQPEMPSYSFNRNLKYGMSGPDVEMLQKILKYEGDFTLGYTTQYFGMRTKEAVQKYQRRNGIKATGNFWDVTRGHLNNKYQPKKKALE